MILLLFEFEVCVVWKQSFDELTGTPFHQVVLPKAISMVGMEEVLPYVQDDSVRLSNSR